MNCTLEKAAKLLLEKQSFIFLCHIHPDGDTVGSAYALKYALEAVGKSAEVKCAEEIPPRLRFLTELSSSDRTREPSNATVKEKLVCAIDVAETHLLGANGAFYDGVIGLKIDHHPNGSEYARYNYIDGKAAACGEIIFKLLCRLNEMGGCKMTESVCTCLYAALASDTGCFRYTNTTSETMRIAAALIDGGANNGAVNHLLFEMRSKAEMTARRYMLNNISYHMDGKVATLMIDADFRRSAGAADDDIGGLVSEMREIEGVELAICLKQDLEDPSKFKISMRSGEGIAANELCQMFGGGGHERAAGGMIISGSPEKALSEVTEKVIAAI